MNGKLHLRHNTHEHREAINNEVNSNTLIQRVGFYGSDVYYWLIELTVTDAAGLSTKDSAKIFPDLSTVAILHRQQYHLFRLRMEQQV